MRTYSLDTTIAFGKHNGETVAQVASSNPNYLNWCLVNLSHFYLSKSTADELSHKYPKFKLSEEAANAIQQKTAELEANHYTREYDDDGWDWDTKESGHTSAYDSEYYDDNLDLDQQDMEFWNQIS